MKTRTLTRTLFLAAIVTALVTVTGCDGDGGGKDEPTIAITGGYSVNVGATVSLTAATLNGEDAGYSWSSGDDTIATVDADGVVTGVAAGETTITATGDDTGATGMHPIVVVTSTGGDPVVVVDGDFLVAVGSTITLSATTTNGTDSAYTWSSADDTIATVDADGVVTGVATGEVVITATGDDTGASGAWGVVVTEEGFDPSDIPNYTAWMGSGHADTTAEAFHHWDEDDPAEVPTDCAKCHSTPGFRDFIGDDGSAAGVVDAAAPIGTVISCQACHNATAMELDSVTFPSGHELTGLGPEARCMTCHQGRESTVSVDESIADAAAADLDTTDDDLGFKNVHYFAAGATLNGGRVMGGYQYADNSYDDKFAHVSSKDTCNECHDPHSLEVKVDTCAMCHDGVTTVEDTYDIRMMSSLASDYDGDGNMEEGIKHEIDGLHDLLLEAIQAYVVDMGLDEICYAGGSYPYWFIDTDASGGVCDDTEAAYANAYGSWTGRLVQATYNYQYAQKDTGGFAHNAKYVIQLMYDSIADLNTVLGTPVDLSMVDRDDHGHFQGSAEAYRHWDGEEDGWMVESDCAKCHGGAEGLHFYLEYGVGTDVPVTNGMQCEACHDGMGTSDTDFTVMAVDDVTFPSHVTIDLDTAMGDGANLCGTCRSGRESMATVDEAIADTDYGFLNVHYLPAAATFQGTDAQVGYEYGGKTYAGGDTHSAGASCTYCHSPADTEHTFSVEENFDGGGCACHSSSASVEDIRMSAHQGTDYDGDGDDAETLGGELETLAEDLLASIQTYAGDTVGTDICYAGSSYPYWFIDTDGSGGMCDGTEASYANAYNAWDATLMKAAFNYQLWVKEPGAWAHNFDYVAQLLIDSIEDTGGVITGYTRP